MGHLRRFTIAPLRLLWLTVFSDGANGRLGPDALLPPRADIVDRNGEVLARTMDAWSIGVHPDRLLNRPADLAPKLAALMAELAELWYASSRLQAEIETQGARWAPPTRAHCGQPRAPPCWPAGVGSRPSHHRDDGRWGMLGPVLAADSPPGSALRLLAVTCQCGLSGLAAP